MDDEFSEVRVWCEFYCFVYFVHYFRLYILTIDIYVNCCRIYKRGILIRMVRSTFDKIKQDHNYTHKILNTIATKYVYYYVCYVCYVAYILYVYDYDYIHICGCLGMDKKCISQPLHILFVYYTHIICIGIR